ncbi:hypothetical protein NQ315_003790 [Exocentrus adspersus]|uniref:DUF7775 domain-containing protein n=1 Tax=Exocentrus adspersus TaxID=1586481 RepID=A0AAV8VDQ3_9CUCU|nr:hypothetical protein NQ315_003790 [Exocentrus adspersus]
MEFRKLTLLKCLELAIAVACMGLHYRTRTNDFDTDTLSCTSYGGYIIILVGTIGGIIAGTPMNRRIYIFYCLVGCAIFVAAGALNIEIMKHWGKSELRDYGLSKAILSIINGALFLIDALVEWREY